MDLWVQLNLIGERDGTRVVVQVFVDGSRDASGPLWRLHLDLDRHAPPDLSSVPIWVYQVLAESFASLVTSPATGVTFLAPTGASNEPRPEAETF